ncbi:branched-chain amino acid ABC transporter permease [Paracoccaceae bacterium]|nr:branched-chain amino acid ABC transporter permease [Paracoccaceae bacterium]
MEDKQAKFRKLPLLEIIILGFLIVAPLFLGDFYTVILTRMLILCLLAISFELCWGYSGIMTFGQGLFFGMAGYTVALLANKVGFVQIWGVIPIGIFVGTVVSFLLAWLLLLGKKAPEIIFVALGTLTFSYAAERLVSGWYYVGGGNGLSIFEFLSFGSYEIEPGVLFYYIAGIALLVSYLLSRYLVRSQLGLVLAAMRQDEKRLLFLGYRVRGFKALVFTFAGAVAGLGGALYAHHEGFIGPNNMGIGISTMAVLYTLFGGVGSLIGPLVGVFALETISFTLSGIDAFKSFWPVILGAILLVVVTFKPDGLTGFIVSRRERIGTFGRIKKKEKISREETKE